MNSEIITAIYEDGVLRPTTPLELPEHARVQIQVRQIVTSEDLSTHRRRLREALVAAGLVLPTQPSRIAGLLTPERRAELARKVSAGRPLSETIIEEREGR